jgi:cytochrome c-type biogenesis protein CcmH
VITFLSIAALMLAVALVWVLVPLLKGVKSSGVAREASNVAILRDQLKELETDVGNGIISRDQYDQARTELEQRVLDESKAMPGSATHVPSAAGAWTAAVLAGALPIAAVLIYFMLGSHDAFSPAAKAAADAQHDMSPEKVESMVTTLAAKLEKDPNNAQGWSILAHTYYAMNRLPQAVAAYERAVKLDPDNANLLADYADALGSQQNGLEGKPMELVTRALLADPTQWKALALAGTYAFDRKDYKSAVEYWEKLRATIPPESNMAKSLEGSIAEARQLGGIAAAAAPAKPAASAAAPSAAPTPPAATASAKAPAAGSAAGSAIAGNVNLSPGLAANAAPSDTVFVFARPAQGSKMPLAIIRKQVKDLPIAFNLDDSMAMSPDMKISNFPEVVVGARISKSGNAMPQAGDLEGFSKPVKIGASGVAVVIDTPRP